MQQLNILIAALALAAVPVLAGFGRQNVAKSESAGSAIGRKGIVATSSAPATRVGVQILRGGGNAVDAAVATALALAVTYPAAGNIGGGGFMVVRMRDGRTAAIDFRETAPALAGRDLYVDEKGAVIPRASLEGHRASGVPGTVAGLALARDRFGAKPWRDLVEPARLLAASGFELTESLARDLRTTAILSRFPETRRIFQRDGSYFARGDIFKQPELAATLERIRDRGPREFYEGETARLIAKEIARGNGLITLGDLKGYRAVMRKTLSGSYRGFDLITMPPPSSGGIALLEMLNILECRDERVMKTDSPQRSHLIIEAMRRAFADRARYLGDSDFVQVPVKGMTSKSYAKEIADKISPTTAARSAETGHGDPIPFESPQTTHFSVVDSAGNAVAVTYTLNTGYGSGVTVTGAGFLLNNEMDDFTSRPGTPNVFGLIQGEANSIAPKKRPLSSMTPTIVMRKGKLFMVLGSPGGPTIINTVMQVFLNAADLGMNLEEAVRAPRIHHQWLPDQITFERKYPESARSLLQLMGHRFQSGPATIGDVQAIMIQPDGIRVGFCDPRSTEGLALAE